MFHFQSKITFADCVWAQCCVVEDLNVALSLKLKIVVSRYVWFFRYPLSYKMKKLTRKKIKRGNKQGKKNKDTNRENFTVFQVFPLEKEEEKIERQREKM